MKQPTCTTVNQYLSLFPVTNWKGTQRTDCQAQVCINSYRGLLFTCHSISQKHRQNTGAQRKGASRVSGLRLGAVREGRILGVQGTGQGDGKVICKVCELRINSPGLRSTGGVTAAAGKREDVPRDLNLIFQPRSPSHSSAMACHSSPAAIPHLVHRQR